MYDMIEIGQRIKAIRLERGMSLDNVADEIGVAKSTIQRYENGKIITPKIPVLHAIARVLRVNPGWLLGKSERKEPEVPSKKPLRVPVLGRVAAGIPFDAVEEIIDWEELDPDAFSDGEYFGLRIRGDSMEPKISNGDVVIVRRQDDADDGDLVIALVNGDDGVCKRLRKYSDSIALVSTNPAYDPLYFSKGEIDNTPVRIIGKVKELRAKF